MEPTTEVARILLAAGNFHEQEVIIAADNAATSV
jgi:hypothetical protein